MISRFKVAVPGIDLAFRPASYFWPMGLETHLLSRIKGAERKAAVQGLIDAGRVDDVFGSSRNRILAGTTRKAVGSIPRFIGTRPVQPHQRGQIAGVPIASTLQDVTSVFACRGKRRIYYRVVDEYNGETLSGRATRTSVRPLTLGELEELNGAWSILEILEMNFGDDGYEPDGIRNFASASSAFYPQIGGLYAQRIHAWTAERRRERGV